MTTSPKPMRMSQGPVIRRARPADAEGLARVNIAAWQDAYPGVLPEGYLLGMSSQTDARRWRVDLWRPQPGTRVFVADDPARGPQRRILGYGMCGPQRSRLPGIDGEFYALYVDPAVQQGGLGRRLMAAMADYMIGRRITSACVWVLRDNPARWFYQGLGGRLAGEQAIPFAGIKLPQLAYAWPDTSALSHLVASASRSAPGNP